MDVRCYYIAQGFVIAGFGYSFSRLNSRIQVVINVDSALFVQFRSLISHGGVSWFDK